MVGWGCSGWLWRRLVGFGGVGVRDVVCSVRVVWLATRSKRSVGLFLRVWAWLCHVQVLLVDSIDSSGWGSAELGNVSELGEGSGELFGPWPVGGEP